jgi:hypothetical protein
MAKRSRRALQVFNMSFLDMITNFTGACILLLLLSMTHFENTPCPEIKYTTYAHFDEQQKILWDTLNSPDLQDLKTGDLILVKIDTFLSLRSKDCPTCPPQRACLRNHYECKPVVCPPPCPPDGGCNIVGSVETSDCKEDYYTALVLVKSAGNCNTTWRDNQGHYGTYNVPQKLTFNVNEGNKVLLIADTKNSNAKCSVTIFPPKCKESSNSSSSNVATTTTTNDSGEGKLTGILNFQLSWSDVNDRVNLYVEKEGKWVYGGRKKDDNIGEWYQARSGGGLNAKILNIEELRQFNGIKPGTYTIYTHYKAVEGRDAQGKKNTIKSSISTTLTLSIKGKTTINRQISAIVPYSKENPRSGGGKKIATVTISKEGLINIQ